MAAMSEAERVMACERECLPNCANDKYCWNNERLKWLNQIDEQLMCVGFYYWWEFESVDRRISLCVCETAGAAA